MSLIVFPSRARRARAESASRGISCMSAEPVFLDTNILVYANDTEPPDKRRSARELVSRVVRDGTGHVSAQVLSEFWVTVTGKFVQPLDRDIAQHQLALYSSLVVIPTDIGLVLDVVQRRHGRRSDRARIDRPQSVCRLNRRGFFRSRMATSQSAFRPSGCCVPLTAPRSPVTKWFSM